MTLVKLYLGIGLIVGLTTLILFMFGKESKAMRKDIQIIWNSTQNLSMENRAKILLVLAFSTIASHSLLFIFSTLFWPISIVGHIRELLGYDVLSESD